MTRLDEIPSPEISVIIPTLNEESAIEEALQALAAHPDAGRFDVIVVDGGSRDATVERAKRFSRVLSAPRGRSAQMNAGARAARGDVFLFVHADTRLPPDAFSLIQESLTDPKCCGGAFRHSLDRDGFLYRLISSLSNLRVRWLGVIYGDQAPFVRREVFEALGGFREMEILEDADFTSRMRKAGRVELLKAPIVTSARRWERMGPWRTIFRMWAIALGTVCGISPAKLKRLYPDVR